MTLYRHTIPARSCLLYGLTWLAVSWSIPFLAIPAKAAPQGENESMVLQYGPDLEMFNRQSIELALKSWQWQNELSEVRQQKIAKMKREWVEELEMHQQELKTIQSELRSSGLSFPLDGQAVNQIDQQIRELQSSYVGLTAQLNQLKAETGRVAAELKLHRQAKQGELSLLKSRLRSLVNEYERVKQLRDKGVVPESEVDQLRDSVLEMEIRLKNQVDTLQAIEAQMDDEQAVALTSITTQREAIKRRLQELETQKEKVEQLQPVQAIEELQMRSNMARRLVEMAEVKIFELQLENTRNQALVDLVEKQLREQPDNKSDR